MSKNSIQQKARMKFTIITLFPDALRPYLETSMMWKAAEKGIVEFEFVNLRDFGLGPHKSVDDTPYGGGDGMVMRPEPIYAAIEMVKEKARGGKAEELGSEADDGPTSKADDGFDAVEPEVILPTPDGMTWSQDLARQFVGITTPDTSMKAHEDSIMARAEKQPNTEMITSREQGTEAIARTEKEGGQQVPKRHYIIFCPHYEGYDARILDIIDHKISLGNYVLTGGELPALVIIDSIVRLLPGVLGGDTSAALESFSDGNNIEAPQYTKPQEFRGKRVPEVLLSGDHAKVAAWRKEHEKTRN